MKTPVVYVRCSLGLREGLRAIAKTNNQSITAAAADVLHRAVMANQDARLAMNDADAAEAETIRTELEEPNHEQ